MRKNVLCVAMVALFCGGLMSAAAAGEAKTLKIGYILAPNSQLGAGATAFAETLAKKTDGRFKVEQAANSALGGEVDMLKGLQLGSVDLAFITGAPLPNFVPEVGVLSVPFLFRDAKHAHAVLEGPVGAELLGKFTAKDLVALGWGENGMRHITNSKHPIAAPEDLKGLKLRVPQSEVMLAGFKALGADAAPLPFPELYGALQSGKFDGQENPIATIVASKFAQVQKHLTMSGHVYDPAVFFASKDVWEDLSEADRAAFVEAAKAGGAASRKFAAEAEANGVAALEKDGLAVVKSIDREKFVAALAPAMGGYAEKFGPELIAKIRDVK
jgi:tripartite ATP-independent transporter DctP family solute receptor